jgi:CubicO group peptidase (beta-lactamase class C family)
MGKKYMTEITDVETRLRKIDAIFARWDTCHAPGLVAGIAQHGRTLYRRAFGMASLEAAVANTPSTRMRIGSTSKHFLSLTTLLLQEEGKLQLDDPIGRYLPELTGEGGRPSLRQLLGHRGGIRCHLDLGFLARGMLAPPVGSGLALMARQVGGNFAPGEAMIYCNGGYHLISLAVERVTGTPLADVLRERFFDPMGMASTSQVASDFTITPGIACLHLPSADGTWRRGLFPSRELLGEGGIVSTIDDMLVWLAHLRTRERFGSADTWRQLTAVTGEPNGDAGYYALGLVVSKYRGVGTLGHPGGVVGGSSEMICIPALGLDIVILCNGAKDAFPMQLAQQVLDILLSESLGAAAAAATPGRYASSLGDYASAETGMVYGLEQQGETLLLRVAKCPDAIGLEVAPDGWLQTGISFLGRIRLQVSAEDREGIVVEFAGERKRHTRLAGMPAGPQELRLDGVYYSEECGVGAEFYRSGSGTVLRTWDHWGSAELDVIPLGGAWLYVRSREAPEEFGAVIHFADSAEGRRFRLNSARTRDLTFTAFKA